MRKHLRPAANALANSFVTCALIFSCSSQITPKNALDSAWQKELSMHPIEASRMGYPAYAHQLPRSFSARHQALSTTLNDLAAALPNEEAIRLLLERAAADHAALSTCRSPWLQLGHPFEGLSRWRLLGAQATPETWVEHQHLLKVLPKKIEAFVTQMKTAVDEGSLPSLDALQAERATLQTWLALSLEEDPLLGTLHAETRLKLLPEIQQFRAALERYERALESLEPQALPRPGLVHQEGGAECYEALVQHHIGGAQDLDALVVELEQRWLRDAHEAPLAHDKLAPSPSAPQAFLSQTLEALPTLTRALPHLSPIQEKEGIADTLVLQEKPEDAPASFPVAYYQAKSSTNGVLFMDLKALENTPFRAALIVAHEGFLGHHGQALVDHHLQTHPWLRRRRATACSEGRAIAAERAVVEEGLLAGPEAREALHKMARWRLARARADLGIHHQGWSREEATLLLKEAGLSADEARRETTRVIALPGQALAYVVEGVCLD